MSQQVLSDLADYKRAHISDIEQGKRTASLELIKRIGIAVNERYERILAVKIVDALTPSEEEALWQFLDERRGKTEMNKKLE